MLCCVGYSRFNPLVNLPLLLQEGGFRALYRGFVPTLCGMVPYAGFSFYCFEMFKFVCMKYMPTMTCNENERNTGGLVLQVPAKLLCGGFAGAVVSDNGYKCI